MYTTHKKSPATESVAARSADPDPDMSDVLPGDSTEPTTLAAAVASLRAEMLPVVLTMTVNVVPVAGAAGRMKSQVLPAVTLHVYTPPLLAAFRVTVWVRGPAPALVDPVTTGRTVAGPATVMSEDTDTAALEATLCSTDNPLLITAALLTGTSNTGVAPTLRVSKWAVAEYVDAYRALPENDVSEVVTLATTAVGVDCDVEVTVKEVLAVTSPFRVDPAATVRPPEPTDRLLWAMVALELTSTWNTLLLTPFPPVASNSRLPAVAPAFTFPLITVPVKVALEPDTARAEVPPEGV